MDEAFDNSWTGKTLAEVTPPSLQVPIISASEHCASTGCAVYTVLRTLDGAGHSIDLDRLLLPFGKDGQVQLILASLQLNSNEGAVERSKIFQKFQLHSKTVLALRISAGSFNENHLKPVAIDGGKRNDYGAAQKEIFALNRAGKLKDATVNRFAVGREYDLVIAALSFMSEAKIETIEPLLREDRLDELIVACKASRLSWATTTMIIRNRPRCRPVSDPDLEQGLHMFEALPLSVAQQTVRIWAA